MSSATASVGATLSIERLPARPDSKLREQPDTGDGSPHTEGGSPNTGEVTGHGGSKHTARSKHPVRHCTLLCAKNLQRIVAEAPGSPSLAGRWQGSQALEQRRQQRGRGAWQARGPGPCSAAALLRSNPGLGSWAGTRGSQSPWLDPCHPCSRNAPAAPQANRPRGQAPVNSRLPAGDAVLTQAKPRDDTDGGNQGSTMKW